MKGTNLEHSWRRWDGADHEGTVHSKPKKVNADKAYDMVLNAIKDGLGAHCTLFTDRVYAEKIAIDLNIEKHVVKQVFHKLNLEGKMSQAILWNTWAMHTRNDPHGDDPVQWQAKYYNVYREKL